jgi:predicted Zn-dependent peptidase
MNAFTSKEYTCFYARVIDTDLPMAIDVVSDLITSSVVTALDVDAERKVVLEEIAMRDDDPSDLVHDLYAETYYGDTPLGRPILGTIDSINSMSRNAVFNYYKKRYLPQDLVVAVAGNIKHKKVVAMVEAALSKDGFLDVMGAPVIRPSTPVKKSVQQSVGLIPVQLSKLICFMGWKALPVTMIDALQWEFWHQPLVAECLHVCSKRFAKSADLHTLFMHTPSSLQAVVK